MGKASWVPTVRGLAWAGLLHLVTRSSSKALIPWAAFSRVSSLAGGPCESTQCHHVPDQAALTCRAQAEAQGPPSQPAHVPAHMQTGD